ncbi:hypothetical protein Goshw_018898, partial [Gossypium schwendimanii]|nr:hypothetical protein [Gossypium schwendimanii]
VLQAKYGVTDEIPENLSCSRSSSLWGSLTKRLLTSEERVRQGLGQSSVCKVYSHISEDVLHVLRDCPATEDIWNLLIPTNHLIRFYSSNTQEWIASNLLNQYDICFLEVSLNTDGSVRFEDDSVVAEGVVRNQKGKWIIGYNRFLGSCSVFKAELWGILDGLNLLIDCGLDNVMIHSNSIEVVMAIQESSTGRSNTALIRRILQLLSQTSHWNIYNIPREENQEADNLAKFAHSGRQGLRMFGKPSCGELG